MAPNKAAPNSRALTLALHTRTIHSHNVLLTQRCQLDSASVVYVSGGPAGGPSPDQQHEIQKHTFYLNILKIETDNTSSLLIPIPFFPCYSPPQKNMVTCLYLIRRINCKRSPEYFMCKEDTSFTEHFMCMKKMH